MGHPLTVRHVTPADSLAENGGMMETPTTYRYLEPRPDKQSRELFIRGTGVRTSTIWHDRYISRMTSHQIAQNRDPPEAAVFGSVGILPGPLGRDLCRKGC